MAERPTHRRARSFTSLVRRQESCGPTVLSILVQAYQVRWRNVEERLATHASEATQLDSSGCSVLYRALFRRADDYPPFPIVRAILRAYPQAIWQRCHNMTLLELAIRRMASLETLELLCQARPAIPEDNFAVPAFWQVYTSHFETEERFVGVLASGTPEAFDIGCKFQLLLRYLTTEQLKPCGIHSAAASPTCSLNLFKLFCRVFANDFAERTRVDGMIPLHLALEGAKIAESESKNHQVAKANYLRNFDPTTLQMKTSGGRLPIHLGLEGKIVQSGNASDWIGKTPSKTLGKLDPKTGLYAFQMAASMDASVSTIFSLLRPFTDIITWETKYESNPKVDEVTSEDLLQIDPEWITPQLQRLLSLAEPAVWDELQKTLRTPVDPLWHQLIGAARVFGCPLPLLRLLIALHPEKLMHEDQLGWMPLHHAVVALHGEHSEVVRILLEACPRAAHHRDKDGLLPFHLAILSGKGPWLLELLKEYNPSAMNQPGSRYGLPPALLAAQCSRSNLSSVYFLISSAPELVVSCTHEANLEEGSMFEIS
jgi:hypothetical protein